MLIYAAGPIDQVDKTNDASRLLSHLRESVLGETAKQNGWVLFRPDRAYEGVTAAATDLATEGPKIDRVNLRAIDEADLVVAILIAGIPTLGTPAEVGYAIRAGKPVVILADPTNATLSIQIASWRNMGARVVSLGMSTSKQDLAAQRIELHAQVVAAVSNLPRFMARGNLTECPDEPVDGATSVRLAEHPVLSALTDGKMMITFGPQETERQQDAGWVEPQSGVLLYSPANVVDSGLTTSFDLSRAYPDDAGFDLTAVGQHVVSGGGAVQIPTSVSIAPPPDHWALLVGRSSTWTKLGLMTIPGVIDTGWRGPLYAQVYNPGTEPVTIAHNQRIAQLILLPTWQGKAQYVQELPEHDRGTNGFGSSGGHGEPVGARG